MWLLDQSMVNLKFIQGLFLFLNYSSTILRASWSGVSSSKSCSLWIGAFGYIDITRSLTNWHLLVILEHIGKVALLCRLDPFLILISVVWLTLQRLESGHITSLFPWGHLALPHICRRINVWHVDVVNIFVVLVLHCWHWELLRPWLAWEGSTVGWRLVLQVNIRLVLGGYMEGILSIMSCTSVLVLFYHGDFGTLVALLSQPDVLGMWTRQLDVSSSFQYTLWDVLEPI